MKVLVTGGAGYIGSHVVWLLGQRGHHPIVFDNLGRGHADAVRDAPLVRGDLLQPEAIRAAMAEHCPDAVMHFAALSIVPESMRDPRLYFHENVVGALNLLEAMREQGVSALVFSSTAATYGIPTHTPIAEDHPQRPVNPYGASKLAIEHMLAGYDHAHGVRHAILRYFNAAGAAADQGLGERHDPETHLIPLLLRVASGEVAEAKIFGRDYDTPDGTCVRDYIHVLDLAEAHIVAVEQLCQGQPSMVMNLGTGSGHSVLEVLQAVRSVTGHALPVRDAPRREGDPPVLVAGAQRARQLLGWSPTRSDLHSIVSSAWRFHRGQTDATHP